MSAYVHTDAHIITIVSSVQHHKLAPVTIQDIFCDVCHEAYADLVTRILKAENIRSVNERYDDNEPLYQGIKFKAVKPLKPIGLYKAIRSLNYQSCESSDWDETFACGLLEHWMKEIEKLLGMSDEQIMKTSRYDEADWSIH